MNTLFFIVVGLSFFAILRLYLESVVNYPKARKYYATAILCSFLSCDPIFILIGFGIFINFFDFQKLYLEYREKNPITDQDNVKRYR